MLVKCICTNCAGHLEFEEENAGETIDCPHCGFDTTLFLPGAEPPEAALAAERASRLRLRRRVIAFGVPLLILAGLGYVLYRWVLPSFADALPFGSDSVLPALIMIASVLAMVGLLVWIVFPVLLLLQIKRLTMVISDIEDRLPETTTGRTVWTSDMETAEAEAESEPESVAEQPAAEPEGESPAPSLRQA